MVVVLKRHQVTPEVASVMLAVWTTAVAVMTKKKKKKKKMTTMAVWTKETLLMLDVPSTSTSSNNRTDEKSHIRSPVQAAIVGSSCSGNLT